MTVCRNIATFINLLLISGVLVLMVLSMFIQTLDDFSQNNGNNFYLEGIYAGCSLSNGIVICCRNTAFLANGIIPNLNPPNIEDIYMNRNFSSTSISERCDYVKSWMFYDFVMVNALQEFNKVVTTDVFYLTVKYGVLALAIAAAVCVLFELMNFSFYVTGCILHLIYFFSFICSLAICEIIVIEVKVIPYVIRELSVEIEKIKSTIMIPTIPILTNFAKEVKKILDSVSIPKSQEKNFGYASYFCFASLAALLVVNVISIFRMICYPDVMDDNFDDIFDDIFNDI